jgi:DNA invertase Pin-like site-specific DNA recombinase
MTPKQISPRFVAYYRVSTERQGRSGLGLKGQETAVEAHLLAAGGKLLRSFKEIQSGKDNDRPQLKEALKHCRVSNAVLLIAKLDRLSRNAAFLLALRDSGARFVACDMPDMNETVVGIMAVIAQAERRMISERTKAALAAVRVRKRLGNPRLKPGNARTAAHAREQLQAKAQERAEELREMVDEAKRSGCSSLRSLAGYLNDANVATPRRDLSRQSQWTACAVSRLLDRLAA